MITVIAVVGATASGKSSLGIELAQKFNGEIVSCDSVQIYKYFNIGSAKATESEQKMAPHHLIDLLDPHEQCNAGLWKDLAIQKIEDIHHRGKLPIIVGGTGLYLKSLFLGMFEQESRDDAYRLHLLDQVKSVGLPSLYEELQIKDPSYAAKISPQDQLRILRALEAMFVTNIKFSELHLHNTKPSYRWIFTQTDLSREEIYQKIANRVDHMIEAGLLEETRAIIDRFGDASPVFGTIGYRHVRKFLNAEYDLKAMRDELILDTRHYAKRQQTLYRSLLKNERIFSPKEMLQGIFHENI
ncbi:MAG: tRNA (adenosine(37)-N6)-dimethylallyltransferase MiaA [Brevinema sp.]